MISCHSKTGWLERFTFLAFLCSLVMAKIKVTPSIEAKEVIK